MNAGSTLLAPLLGLVYKVLDLYIGALIVGAIMSWLVAFNIINSHNRFIQMVGDFLYRITEPFLRPIRRMLPPMGGLDLSPMALIFIVWVIQIFIRFLMIQLMAV